MKGTEIKAYLGNKLSNEREDKILELVRAGHYLLNFVPVYSNHRGRRAILYTSNDALRLGDETDSFRPGMTQRTQQRIADELNAVLGTPQLSDLAYAQAAVRPKPVLHYGGPHMADTETMIKHSAAVDDQVHKLIAKDFGSEVDPRELLISTVGKDWVNSRRLIGSPMVKGQPAGINYGGHRQDVGPKPEIGPFPSSTMYPPVVVHQSEGRAHSYNHTDYSQVGRFWLRLVELCEPLGMSGFETPGCSPGSQCRLPDGNLGVSRCLDIYDVAQNEELWPLVSHNGPVYMRHFAVPWAQPEGTGMGQGIWQGFPVKPPPPNLVEGAAPPPPGPGDDEEPPTVAAGVGLVGKTGLFLGSLAAGWYGAKWLGRK